MVEKYIDLGQSLLDFKKEIGFNYAQTQFLLKYYKIPIRGLKESNASNRRQEKSHLTVKQRYGVDNISQLQEVKEKKRATFTTKYGVDNIRKAKEYHEQLHKYMFKTYGHKSLPNRYGGMNQYQNGISNEEKKMWGKRLNDSFKQWYENLCDVERESYNKNKATALKEYQLNLNDDDKRKHFMSLFSSSLEDRVSSILNTLRISHVRQYFIGRKGFDFKLSGTNIIIEVHGDFQHGNPLIYKKDDVINHPIKHVTAGDLQTKDFEREKLVKSYGFVMVVIQESEMKNLSDDDLATLIINKIDQIGNNHEDDESKINTKD